MTTAVNRTTIQDIVLEMDKQGKIGWNSLNYKEEKLLKNIRICHTQKCGYTRSVCPHCQDVQIHYGSCRNGCCPQCGEMRRKQWADSMRKYILDVPYHHIIFTVPHEWNELFLKEPKYMYNLLFQSVHHALKTMAADPKYLGASQIGFTACLHTWGQNLSLHPHIHCLFPAGGLNKKGEWAAAKKGRYLFPAKALAALFKGYFTDNLLKHYGQDPEIEALCRSTNLVKWNVEIRKPTKNPDHVVKYLARYVNRMAISNSRILSYEKGKVRFKYKDYRDGNKIKEMELQDTEFLRRFLMHVLPPQFNRIRGFGFMANNCRNRYLEKLQKATKTKIIEPAEKSTEDYLSEMFGWDIRYCRKCGEALEVDINYPFYFRL